MVIMKKGVVLISVMIILLTMSVIGISLVAFFSAVSMSAQTIVDEAKAFYLAEAGIARAIGTLQDEDEKLTLDLASGIMGQSIPPVKLGEGTYEVFISKHNALITSIGKVHGIAKKMQLRYGAF